MDSKKWFESNMNEFCMNQKECPDAEHSSINTQKK